MLDIFVFGTSVMLYCVLRLFVWYNECCAVLCLISLFNIIFYYFYQLVFCKFGSIQHIKRREFV